MRLLLIVFFLMAGPSWAQDTKIYIDVGRATVKKSLLALTPLSYFGSQPDNKSHLEAGQDLYKTIFNDLTVSDFFTFIKQDAYLEDPAKVGLKPAPNDPKGFNFQSWKAIGTEFLVRGGYKIIGSKLSLEIYVYHVPQAKLILGKTYEGPSDNPRKMGHLFANDLVQALTGKRGMFTTRIAATMRENNKSPREVHLMDWDGANLRKVSNHTSLALSPAWSPKGDKIAYTAFAYHKNIKGRNADLFIYELNTAKRWLVSYRKGINSGANFLPDGDRMLLTISSDGTPDIYKISTDGKDLSRITNGPNRAMNVEPAISPDGKKIAFSSDRSGQPMIYVMNADGSGIKRLTFAGKYNSTPSWSPDGKSLVFASYDKTHFDLYLINIEGTILKRLTEATTTTGKPADNRDPSFSPDGRHIVFTSNRSGNRQIYIIGPDGENERRITFDKYEWDQPKWSPFLD